MTSGSVKNYIDGDFIYDLETYPNCFTMAIVRADGKHMRVYEISDRKNELEQMLNCFRVIRQRNFRMVGFNSLQFDYPIVHEILLGASKAKQQGVEYQTTAAKLYRLAMKQIESFKGDGFGHTVKADEVILPQLDLFKVHHFDNKARATSLKMIEFNMRADTIEDLPFPVGTKLTSDQIDTLIKYNKHDVLMTLAFYQKSIPAILFREQLSEKYGRNFINHNDGKIGKDYFAMKLEQEGIKLRKTDQYGKSVLIQSKRDSVGLGECLFNYYDFSRPEFIAVKQWFSKQRITETKGVFSDIEEHDLGAIAQYAELTTKKRKFKQKPSEEELQEFKQEHPLGWIETEELKATEYLFDANGQHVMEYPLDSDGMPDFTKKQKKVRTPKLSYWGCWKIAETLNCVVNGFRFDFGVGGIHGSLLDTVVKETSKYAVIDADVASMYPNIGISNRVYPEHLTARFCDIYEDVYNQRKSYPKSAPENGMLKLALNSVYGDSNNKFSVFYDPKYTMTITVNGQLSLCLLADKLMQIDGLKLIQANTDGITVACLRDKLDDYYKVCKQWEQQVKLDLEYVQYSKMLIANVNNYIAVDVNGKVKRKGLYQYEGLGWHMNQSALVVPKAAEAAMLSSCSVAEFVTKHAADPDNKHDFMLRTKVPRSSRLVMVMQDGTEQQQQNICRYYACSTGGKLVKIMPPLEGDTDERRLSIDSQWNVQTCNNINGFTGNIDLDYYIAEAEKLLIGVAAK